MGDFVVPSVFLSLWVTVGVRCGTLIGIAHLAAVLSFRSAVLSRVSGGGRRNRLDCYLLRGNRDNWAEKPVSAQSCIERIPVLRNSWCLCLCHSVQGGRILTHVSSEFDLGTFDISAEQPSVITDKRAYRKSEIASNPHVRLSGCTSTETAISRADIIALFM
jgi:hypothetical protein